MQTISNCFLNSSRLSFIIISSIHKLYNHQHVGPSKSFLISVLLCCFAFLCLYPTFTNGMQLIRIGTGGSTGVYYPIGRIIANGLTLKTEEKSSALHGHIGVAQNSAGSIENILGVISGAIEVGLVQADIAAFASEGTRAFKGISDSSSIRAVASLYPEKFQIVVRKDAGIKSFKDLKGKKISVDELGSGTLSVMQITLNAHGMTETDLEPQYLKPVFTREKMKDGRLQGFVMMAGAPMDAVVDLIDTGVTLVPIEPSRADEINRQFQYLYPGKIEKNTYPGIPETPTLLVHSLLIVHENMDDDLVYAITKALFSEDTLRLLKNGHPQGKAITLDTALRGISIPLHPGAERFYKELDLVK